MKQFIVAVIALAALSCHKANNKETVQELDRKVDGTKRAVSDNATDSTASVAITNSPTTAVLQAGSPEWDKKIIKTADLRVELTDYNGFNNKVHQSVKNFGAYVAQEQQLQSEGQLSNEVMLKVPVDQFENLLNFLGAIDPKAKILDKQITSEDVSTQIVDTKSRLETKKRLRDKYFELMNQSKKMDDVIRVQNEISTITEDIEAASSRVEYLSHQSAYSTINLKYYQVVDAAKVDDTTPGFFTNFVQAFKQGGSIITGVFLFLLNIWPIIIGGFAAWYMLRRKMLRSKPQQLN
jgi:hypothetical protein